MRKILTKDIFILFILILLSIPLILPYFQSGYFPTHDGEWAVVRLADMFRQLRDFQIPPRYSEFLNYGYGYPLFNFAYPFPYYLGVVVHSLGLSFIGTIKLLFALTVPLSAICMYLASKEIWQSKVAGFMSAVLYIYYPYRMVDLYVRGSIGESLAFVLFAVTAFLIVKIIKNPTQLYIVLVASVLYGSLILTHNIMVVFYTLILIAVLAGLIVHKRIIAVRSIGIVMVLGILLSCFFWLPALYEKQFIALSKIPIADRDLYYVSVEQLLIPSWGYAPPTESDGFSYQLGSAHVVILFALIAIGFYSLFRKARYEYAKVSLYAVAIIIFFIFLLFPISSVFWKLPLLKEINYPWTLLGPIGFLLSIAAGFISTQKKEFSIIAVILAMTAVPLVLPYAKPERYFERADEFYLTNDATTTSSQEYMPVWVKEKPQKRADNKVVLIGSGIVRDVITSSKGISFITSSQGPATVYVNTIYYPGWEARVDNKVLSIAYDNPKGIIELRIPNGDHKVDMVFKETPIRLLSNATSAISGIGIGLFFIHHNIKKRKRKAS